METELRHLAITLTVCLCLHSSIGAEGNEEFDLFGDGFSPAFEIKIGDLDYEKTGNSSNPQGLFSFSHFKVKSNEFNIFLDNQTHFYDADIYLKENIIGFKGPAAQFVYKLRNEDMKYVESVRWLKMNNLHFLMNKEDILLSGKSFAMREPRTYLVASEFDLKCRRNENYMLNDGDGFLSGCLNGSNAKGLSSIGFGVDYKLYAESGEKLTDFQGYFTEFVATEGSFRTNAFSLNARFKDELEIEASEIEVGCSKREDLIVINEEELLTPCLETISLYSNFVKLTLLPDEGVTSLYKPSLEIKSSSLNSTVQRLAFVNNMSDFELNSFGLNCTMLDEDKLLAGTYIKSCLSNGVSALEKPATFKYLLKDKTPNEEMSLSLIGELKSFRFEEENLTVESEGVSLIIDDEFFLDLVGLNWRCQKERGLDSLDFPKLFEYCKKELFIDTKEILLKDYSNKEQPLQGRVIAKKLNSLDGEIKMELKRVELIDSVDYTRINNMVVDCKMLSEKDILNPNDVIGSCSQNGYISFDSLFSFDSKLSKSSLLGDTFNFNRVSLGKAEASVFDASFRVVDQMLSGEVKVKFLGKERSIGFSGKVSWDEESEVITFKLEKSRLPWGIKSKSIFLYVLRKMLVTEMITYEDDNVLKIAL